jgi:FkbM family methyltransferase
MGARKMWVKALLRSRSVGFATAMAYPIRRPGVGAIKVNGRTFQYRYGTSDAFVLYECVLRGRKAAYFSKSLPLRNEVRTIVDVGANVGASALFWKVRYPEARLLCFEPVAENFALLRRNLAGYAATECYQEGLGSADAQLELIASPGAGNEGGWSIYQRGQKGDEARQRVTIRRSGARLVQLGVRSIDILKVDTEGHEREILRGLEPELLDGTRYIAGELHGERDFELLDWLEQRGYRVGCRKSPRNVLFNFEALRAEPKASSAPTTPQ